MQQSSEFTNKLQSSGLTDKGAALQIQRAIKLSQNQEILSPDAPHPYTLEMPAKSDFMIQSQKTRGQNMQSNVTSNTNINDDRGGESMYQTQNPTPSHNQIQKTYSPMDAATLAAYSPVPQMQVPPGINRMNRPLIETNPKAQQFVGMGDNTVNEYADHGQQIQYNPQLNDYQNPNQGKPQYMNVIESNRPSSRLSPKNAAVARKVKYGASTPTRIQQQRYFPIESQYAQNDQGIQTKYMTHAQRFGKNYKQGVTPKAGPTYNTAVVAASQDSQNRSRFVTQNNTWVGSQNTESKEQGRFWQRSGYKTKNDINFMNRQNTIDRPPTNGRNIFSASQKTASTKDQSQKNGRSATVSHLKGEKPPNTLNASTQFSKTQMQTFNPTNARHAYNQTMFYNDNKQNFPVSDVRNQTHMRSLGIENQRNIGMNVYVKDELLNQRSRESLPPGIGQGSIDYEDLRQKNGNTVQIVTAPGWSDLQQQSRISPSRNVQLHEILDIDINLKSPQNLCVQQAHEILREPQNMATYEQRFSQESPTMSKDYEQASVILSQSYGPETQPLLLAPQYESQHSPENKVAILKSGTIMKNQAIKQSLYDYTNEQIKKERDAKLQPIDRSYKLNTILGTEQERGLKQMMEKNKQNTLSPKAAQRGFERYWTRTHTIFEQQLCNQKMQNHLDQAQQNGVQMRDCEYQNKFKRTVKPAIELDEDETLNSKTLLAYKRRFQDQHLYCQTIRAERNRGDLRAWRAQMKDLEDDKKLRKIYDRIGREHKTLLKERQEAKRDTRPSSKHKYKIENQMKEYEKARSTSKTSKFDVAVVTQSATKAGATRAQTGRVESIETQQMIRKAKAKIVKLSHQVDVKLHPLQREQNLETLTDQRDSNQIMRDFSISELKQESINKKIDEELQAYALKDLELSKHLTLQNEKLKSCHATFIDNRKLRSRSKQNLRPRQSYQEPELISQNVLHEKINEAQNSLQSIKEELKSARKGAFELEDVVQRHNHAIAHGGFEEEARKFLAGEIQETPAQAIDVGLGIADLGPTEQWQLVTHKVSEDAKCRHDRMERMKARKEKRQRQELWANMLRKSSKSPPGQGGAGDKELSNDRQHLHKIYDQYNANGKMERLKSDEKIVVVGENKAYVSELIKSTKVANMNSRQVLEIIRHFTQFTNIFQQLKLNVIQWFKNYDQISEKIERRIHGLYLDEPFLEQILKKAALVTDHIIYTRETQEKETLLYYIFEGNVLITDQETNDIVNSATVGQFFELNQGIQKLRRFKIDDRIIIMKDGFSGRGQQQPNVEDSNSERKHLLSAKPSFLRFSVCELSQLFKTQLDHQFDNVKQELMRFPIFTCLSTEDIEYLSGCGVSQTQMCEYLPNEIIIEEGYKHMDHFYLVVQGSVRMEKFLQLKQNNIWPKSKHTWHQATQVQNVSCAMGDIGAREHFGLREMLYREIEVGGHGDFMPAQCRYAAKNPDITTKLLRISYYDLKKVMPAIEIKNLIQQYDINYGRSNKDATIQVKDENAVKSHSIIKEKDLKKKLLNDQKITRAEQQSKKEIQKQGRQVGSSPGHQRNSKSPARTPRSPHQSRSQSMNSPPKDKKLSSAGLPSQPAQNQDLLRVTNMRDRPEVYLQKNVKENSQKGGTASGTKVIKSPSSKKSGVFVSGPGEDHNSTKQYPEAAKVVNTQMDERELSGGEYLEARNNF